MCNVTSLTIRNLWNAGADVTKESTSACCPGVSTLLHFVHLRHIACQSLPSDVFFSAIRSSHHTVQLNVLIKYSANDCCDVTQPVIEVGY